MSGYLIDSDWVIDALHLRPETTRLLAGLSADQVAVSLISYGELYEGAYYARDAADALAGLHRFLEGVVLLPATPPIMETFAVVRGGLTRQLRRQVGDMDLLIAATALTHDLTLLTRNLRDFQHVPRLRLYQKS